MEILPSETEVQGIDKRVTFGCIATGAHLILFNENSYHFSAKITNFFRRISNTILKKLELHSATGA